MQYAPEPPFACGTPAEAPADESATSPKTLGAQTSAAIVRKVRIPTPYQTNGASGQAERPKTDQLRTDN
jgi:hypothetical protein